MAPARSFRVAIVLTAERPPMARGVIVTSRDTAAWIRAEAGRFDGWDGVGCPARALGRAAIPRRMSPAIGVSVDRGPVGGFHAVIAQVYWRVAHIGMHLEGRPHGRVVPRRRAGTRALANLISGISEYIARLPALA